MKSKCYPVRAHFLEDILEMRGYKITSFNQIDDYGQEKLWKTQRQLAPRKRKNQITTLVEEALSISNFENYSSRVQESLSCWTPDLIESSSSSLGFQFTFNCLV